MIPSFLKMLIVGLIPLFIVPGSAVTTYPSGNSGPCTVSNLIPCDTGCYDAAAAESCCSDDASTFACPVTSTDINSVHTTISTTRTFQDTKTVTLESPSGTDDLSFPSDAFGQGGSSDESIPPGYPTTGVSLGPTSPIDFTCVPSTATVTTTEHHTVTASRAGSGSTASTNITTGTGTEFTSVSVTRSVPSPPTSQSTSPSTDVAPTTPIPSTAPPTIPATTPPATNIPGTSPSQPSQPISSYTPGNGGFEATVPSIFALYMLMMAIAFI